ncbi:phage tail tape measure protein [Ruegeria sp. HKCCD4315]|uniref:phage tail tape measure protein n=1 Tax=unclassified Ruegeria TaxID=2625375 RepID=UPI00352DDD33
MVNTTTTHTMILDAEASQMVRSLDAAEKELGQLVKQFDHAAAAGKRFQAANTNNVKSLKGIQGAMQRNSTVMKQGAVNFGDFIIQVAGGQNAMLAFGQQANQLTSFLRVGGPWMLGFTVATGLIAAFGDKLFEASEDAKKFEEALGGVAKSTDELNAETRRIQTGLTDDVLRLRDARQALKDAQADLNALIAEAEASGEAELSTLDAQVEAKQKLVNQAEEELEKNKEALLANVRAREEKERMVEVMRAVNQKLLESVDLTAAMARNTRLAAEGAAIIANINANPDFYDPRGEGAGAGDPNYRPPASGIPPVVLPPNPSSNTRAGGGGGTRRAIDQQKKLTEEIKKTVEAMRELDRQSQTWFDNFEDGMVGIAAEGIDRFVDAIADAETAWGEFSKQFLRDIAKMILRQALLNALQAALGPGFDVPGAADPGQFFPSAKGNVFDGGSVVPFARGGVVSQPTMFPISGGVTGLMGEAGPEAIAPLRRDGSGNLGVGAVAPVIQIVNNTGAEVQTRQVSDVETQIIIGKAVAAAEQSISRQLVSGQGQVPRAMEQGYTSRRRVV